MKGNKKILAVAALLLLIAGGFSTYAIYKTSVAGTGKVTAAIWNVTFKNGQETLENNYNLTFSGTDCQSTHVAAGKIAPGVSCTKTITLDAGTSEVDVTYDLTHGDVTATKNSASVPTTDANDFTVTITPASGSIGYSAATRTQDVTVTVAWAGTDDSDAQTNPDTINAADTALNGAEISVPITLVAKQKLS